MEDLEPHLELARQNGLGITLHIAEVRSAFISQNLY